MTLDEFNHLLQKEKDYKEWTTWLAGKPAGLPSLGLTPWGKAVNAQYLKNVQPQKPALVPSGGRNGFVRDGAAAAGKLLSSTTTKSKSKNHD